MTYRSYRSYKSHSCFFRQRDALTDQSVINQRAQRPADQRSDDRDPEIEVIYAKDLKAPSRDGREQARAEITRRVDRVTRVQSEGHPERHHQKADRDRPQWARRVVTSVSDGPDDKQQQSRADDLVDQRAGGRKIGLRISGENAGGAFLARDHSHAAGEVIEGRPIDKKDDRRAGERPGDLRDGIRQEFRPRYVAPKGQSERHRRVEMGA